MEQRTTSTVLVTDTGGRIGRETLRELNDMSLRIRVLTRSATKHESLSKLPYTTQMFSIPIQQRHCKTPGEEQPWQEEP